MPGWGITGSPGSATPISGAAIGLRGPAARTRPRCGRPCAGVASLAKRWLLSTHQGAVEPAHLQSYLDEFVFRFNRRRSGSRGMVFYRVPELAAGHEPVRYRNITAGNKPRKTSPVPPAGRGHPPSPDRVTAGRPWRAAYLPYSG